MSVVLLAETTPMTPPPIRMGTDAEFAAVRECLQRAEYTEAAVCALAGTDSIYEFRMLKEGRAPSEITDAAGALLHVFMDSEPMPRSRLGTLLPGGGVEALERLGLLDRSAADPASVYGTVLLYPTQSVYLVSDANGYLDGRSWESPPDVVYPAIAATSRSYLNGLPRTRCERFLEVCGGSGIAALVSARNAGHAWTSDITARSTFFADFNARLNGFGNVTAVQGNLYDGVRGMTFDRIAAHPPYVATDQPTMIFRDAGRDGEEVTRGLLEGLPDVLAPGGQFYCTCFATDRKDAPLEQRLRAMLGERGPEFDVLLAVRYAVDANEYHCLLAVQGRQTFAQAERRIAVCHELGIEQMVYSTMLVERHAAPRPPVTVRRTLGDVRAADALDWLVRYEAMARAPGFGSWLRAVRPVLGPEAVFTARQRVRDGAWATLGGEVEVQVPFRTESRCSPDTAAALARFDGTLSVEELADRITAEHSADRSVVEAQVLEMARFFIAQGVLRVPELVLDRDDAEPAGDAGAPVL